MAGKPFRRKGSKRWIVVVEMPRNAAGERVQKFLYGATRREVQDKQTKLLRELATGTHFDPTDATVATYLDHWLAARRPHLALTTYQRYERAVRLSLKPTLGALALAKLTGGHVSAWVGTYAADHKPESVRTVLTVLKAALKQAVGWHLIQTNPAAGVQSPRDRRPPADLWDAPTAARVLAALPTDGYGILWHLLLMCGMRRGEALGLRWQDTDLDRGVIAIRRALVPDNSAIPLAVSEGKNPTSRRAVALFPETVELLRAHRLAEQTTTAAAGVAWSESRVVCARDAKGTPLHLTTLWKKWRRFLRVLGLPPIRIYDLRHEHATLLLLRGVHPKVVQERLGHTSPAFTLERYSHVLEGLQQRVITELGSLTGDE
jgi:integrase